MLLLTIDSTSTLSISLPPSIGEISTEPSVSEVKDLLLCPLHMIAQSLTSCVQPLTGSTEPSRPATHGTSSALVTSGTDSPTLEPSTPLHTESGPIKKDTKQQVRVHTV